MRMSVRHSRTKQASTVGVLCVSHTHRHIFGITEAPHTNSHGGSSLQLPTQVLSMTAGERADIGKDFIRTMPIDRTFLTCCLSSSSPAMLSLSSSESP